MSILKVVFVIIGTLIGASGQEVYIFFYSYGVKGILGIIISSGIIGFTIYKTLKITKENNIENYKGFLDNFIKKEKLKELLYIPFQFENEGTRILYYSPESYEPKMEEK